MDMIASIGGELKGELGRAPGSNGTECAPEVDGGGERTWCQ